MSTAADAIAAKHNATLKAQREAEALAGPGAGPVPGKGHNSGTSVQAYADRLQNLKEQQRELAEDIKELKAEAKGNEIDPRALEVVVKRRMETAEQREKRTKHEDKLETYLSALGML